MSDSAGYINLGRSVGDRVQVRHRDGSTVAGSIVDDYAELAVPAEQLGRDWAPAHRWATALETGVLVFVDDDALTDDAAVIVDAAGTDSAETPRERGSA